MAQLGCGRWAADRSDQHQCVQQAVATNPDSRRMLVSRLERRRARADGTGALPCAVPVLCRGGKLSCQLYQRSADVFLGLPFNIASYALLTCMFAQQCDLEPGEFIWTGGDCHLYLNHLEQARAAALTHAAAARRSCRSGAGRASIFDYRVRGLRVLELSIPSADPAPPVAVMSQRSRKPRRARRTQQRAARRTEDCHRDRRRDAAA